MPWRNVPTFHTESEEETIALGRWLATRIPARGATLLIGNLGAGKTTLAKGIVEGLGAGGAEEVSSPTFALIHEHGGGRVYHVDLYRIENPRQLATVGLEELFERDAPVLIEWGDRFPASMPADRTEIRIRDLGGDEREIEVSMLGKTGI